jgi:hypothetical protein
VDLSTHKIGTSDATRYADASLDLLTIGVRSCTHKLSREAFVTRPLC